MAAHSEIKNLLRLMGFSLEEGAVGVWQKNYAQHNNYNLKVDIEQKEINYGDKITLGDKTTSNFKAEENFVVLECVNKLLEKGYSPESITLEKDYPLGHKLKGKLDILVSDNDRKAYLMIECKTWGTEYEKAGKKTLSNGGQLLSYFQQDKSTQYLCLYSSRVDGERIQAKYGIIKVEPEFATATNTQEVFEIWNKNLKDNGIFEASSTPYNIVIKALTKNRLLPLTKDDSSRLFNQFAEILRHNVVSDKPNAFNKLITLLLCKIVDEDKGEEEELHFQWLETDNNISLQKRLNDLYKVGMERYLTKVVTDFSDSDVEGIVGLDATQRDIIKHMMTELRLKKNNEFAFKEVFNDPSFEENSKVLCEVVELFQPYQVRYNKKQQFLGDFFELLLNTSIKQEAGQFFTPVPIARFVINSIPLKELMINKISKGDSDFLPYVIDYAVGSGHFLTEAMDELHSKVKELNQSGKYTQPSIKRNLAKWSDDYDWAYDFVYGIEKDYRLVKTAKVSCFLNGDGLARIFNADGLANFQIDTDYKDKLKDSVKGNPKDNQQFEVLIANPPYSVSAFKNTLKDGEKSFDLYNRLTDDSSEIECLFIERAKQLLKDGGYAGIILPSSILSNGGIYEDAREIILKYFKLIAITEFGSSTFMATGTNTVTLFLERRNNSDWHKIEHAVNTFFTNATDVTCNGIEAPFSKYVAHVYKTMSLDDYTTFIRQKPNEVILKHELFADYRKAFDNSTPIKNLKKKAPFKALTETEQEAELNRLFLEGVTKIEKEKLLYFILAYPQQTLLIKANPTGKNEDEKEFLGYEFSYRRGHEGIKPYGAKTIQKATKLYDEESSLNPDKVNTYIYNAFLKKETEVSESLQNNISNQQLVDMLNFERVEFTKSVSLVVKKKVVESRWELVPLGQVCNVKIGGTPSRQNPEYFANGNNLWVSISEMNGNIISDTKEKITDLGVQKSNVKIIKAGATLLSFKLSIGKTAIAGKDLYTNEAIAGLEIKPDFIRKITNQFLFALFNSKLIDLQKDEFNAFGKSLNSEFLKTVLVPIPSIEVQRQINADLKSNEINIEKLKEEINKIETKKTLILLNLSGKITELRSIVEINPSKNEISGLSENTKVSFVEMASVSNDGYIERIVTRELGEVKKGFTFFKDNDILFAKITPCMENGKGALVTNLPTEFGFGSTEFFVLRPSKEILSALLYYITKQKAFRIEAEKNMTGTSGHRRVPKEFLESYQIMLPSIGEQQTKLNQIKEMEKQKDGFKKQIEDLQLQKEAILKKYL